MGASIVCRPALACAAALLLSSARANAEQLHLQDTDHQFVVTGPGELEVAVSGDGEDVLIAVNGLAALDIQNARPRLFHAGHRGHDAFTPVEGASLPNGLRNSRDPTVTWTGAGKFYFATMGPHTNALIASSVDHGLTFTQVAPHGAAAALCSGAGCSSDQPHLAGDRRHGQDQVYIVWRNSRGSGAFFSRIGCSTDGGATWTTRTIEANLQLADRRGDYPRVTVGPDGFVYVILATSRSDGDLLLQRFSPCSAGFHPFWRTASGAGAPSRIAHFAGLRCVPGNTIAGLDRCNTGNILASPTVAVDTANPKHVFVTFATEVSPGNHDVVRLSAIDVTALARDEPFPDSDTLNGDHFGERFFPWSCAADGRLFAGWYDRRSKTARNNDNTEYFVGESGGTETSASDSIDRQCDTGWPSGGAQQEAEACSRQPQMAGFCLPCPPHTQVGAGCDATPVDATPRCDYAPVGACPAGTSCTRPGLNRGAGRYGDYTGIACAQGSAYVAWASGATPAGLPQRVGLSVYFARADMVPLPPPPQQSAACKECRDDRNSCQDGAHDTSTIHACVAEYLHCRSLNHCH